MTLGHLLFAAACTGYILVGIWFEERDLVALFGDQYRHYRSQVGMLIPVPWRKYRPGTAPSATGAGRIGLATSLEEPQP
jgi:hypothetical protein